MIKLAAMNIKYKLSHSSNQLKVWYCPFPWASAVSTLGISGGELDSSCWLEFTQSLTRQSEVGFGVIWVNEYVGINKLKP